MDEVLTAGQIAERFDSEWVLVENPETDQTLQLQGGTVRFHSKDRDEVYEKAVALKPKRFAILYTGEMAENTAIAL